MRPTQNWGEGRVKGAHELGVGAKALRELHRAATGGVQPGAVPLEHPGFGAAKAVNRLLLVAHQGHQRALGEQLEQLGLHRTRVLELVDQEGTPALSVVLPHFGVR